MRRKEDGFTLIELMVVVLILSVLMAIAIPTFLNGRRRAEDRKTQTAIRNGLAAEKVHFLTANQTYTESTATMSALEPGLLWRTGDTPVSRRRVYIHHHAAPNGEVFVSGRSRSGTCFYIREIPNAGTYFADDTACGAADWQTYANGW